MPLTRVERERVADSRLKIQAAASSLAQVDPRHVPDFEGIQECLHTVEKGLRGALQARKVSRE